MNWNTDTPLALVEAHIAPVERRQGIVAFWRRMNCLEESE